MLRRDLDNTPEDIEPAQADAAAAQLPWTRLKKLTIGPFRGFRREEEFDLSHNIVLFQGPNGSGKSSLCEALEFALLGYVEEASAKRIEDLRQYFNNIHEGQVCRTTAAGGRWRQWCSCRPQCRTSALCHCGEESHRGLCAPSCPHPCTGRSPELQHYLVWTALTPLSATSRQIWTTSCGWARPRRTRWH